MEDKLGLKAAADRGSKLRDTGDRILFENEHIRMGEVRLEPSDGSLVGESRSGAP